MTNVLRMYDVTDMSQVSTDGDAYAGYVRGPNSAWPTYDPLVARFPGAHHLSIAPQAFLPARCLDLEPGDAHASQIGSWLPHADSEPVFYSDQSDHPGIVAEVKRQLAAGKVPGNKAFYWVATLDGNYHRALDMLSAPWWINGIQCQPVHAVQWTSRSHGRNQDESVVLADTIFAAPKPAKPTPPVDPHHYVMYPTTPRNYKGHIGSLNERGLVELYDRLRVHPHVRLHQLARIREELLYLAKRVVYLAHAHAPQASIAHALATGPNHWGARFQGLMHRARGARVV